MSPHKEPSTTDEIPPLCQETFLSKGKAIMVVWVLIGIFLTTCCTAIAWAMSTDRAITEVKSTQVYLTDQINSKLDKLLKQQEK